MEDIYFVLLGMFTGILSSLFGIGGGMVIVPTLSFILLPKEAVAVSVFQMAFSSIFGTILNIKKKLLEFKYCMSVACGGLIGGFSSGFILNALDGIYLLMIFFIISVISLYKFISQGKKKVNSDYLLLSERKKIIGVFTGGVLTGLFAISLGIGGGLLLAPIIAYLLGYNSKQIVPIALFFISFSSASGFLSFIHNDVIDAEVIRFGFTIGISSLFGVILGNQILKIIRVNWHRLALILIYIFSTTTTFIKIATHYL